MVKHKYDIGAGRKIMNTTDNVEAEKSIPMVKSDQFDYTNWQRQHFDQKTPDQISEEAETYVTTHPYTGNPSTII